MTRLSLRRFPPLLFAACALLVACGPAAGAERRSFAPSEEVDWYFASTFGTGVYRVGDRTVSVVRLPFERALRDPDDTRWGVRLKLPVTAGFHSVSDAFEDVVHRNVATLAFLPGLEFEKEVLPNWWLKPTASFGMAQDLVGGGHSTLYEIGARSLWNRSFQHVDFSLGNALLYAGNVAQDGLTQHLGVLSTGLNFVVPAGGVLLDRAANLGMHFVHYAYFNRVDFMLDQTSRRSVDQQYEIAVTVGTYRPIDILGFEMQRIGLGVRFGEGLIAVRLVTGFLY